jgi:hypothetical protein
MNTESETKMQRHLEYGVYVWRDGDLFTLLVPELGIARQNEDLNEGFKDMVVAKEEYFKSLAGSGEQSFFPQPRMPAGTGAPIQNSGEFVSPYFSFLMKAAICMLLFFGLGGIGVVVLGNTVAKNLSWATYVVGKRLDDEKVQKYAQQVHRFGEKVKPIIYELKLIWQTEQIPAVEPPNELVNSARSP